MTIAGGEGWNAPPAATAASPSERPLRAIYELSQLLAAPGRLDAVLTRAVETLASLLGLRHAMIVLLDARGEVSAAVAAGWREGAARKHFAALPAPLIARIAGGRTPEIIENVSAAQQTNPWPWGPAPASRRLGFIGAAIHDCHRDVKHPGAAPVIGLLLADSVRDPEAPSQLAEDAHVFDMASGMIAQTLRLYDMVTRDRLRMLDEQRRLEKELPHANPRGDQALSGIVGASRAMRAVFDQINIVARTHAHLLLRGEAGVGKELFARAAHDLSPRRDGPFIKLDCAGLSEKRLESELFGDETAEGGPRKGLFELADGGALLLDEIGEISPHFEERLLRALQEGKFERAGASRTLQADVRFVFSTRLPFETTPERGSSRSDLYCRINAVAILLPPLRDRPDDVTALAEEFLRRFNDENGAAKILSAEALRLLRGCYFPGNVRELENCVRRSAARARANLIGEAEFACSADSCLSSTLWKGFDESPQPEAQATNRKRRGANRVWRDPEAEVRERERLISAMEKAGWVQAKAARLLHLTPRQIAYALDKHQIPVKRF